jgi:DNA-binding CsgD family transcriptional regulator
VRAEAELARTAQARRDARDTVDALARAEELVALLDRIAGPDGPPQALAHQALARAETTRARGDPDPLAWEQAVGRFDALGQPHPAAYARMRQAEAALAAGGGRHDAARLLSSAQRTATALGATALLDDVAALARYARLSLEAAEADPPAAAPPMGLTPREAEVLALLAEGLTNREIGHRLFVTPKTVGTHVGHIFEKLGVHTRVEAASRARGLVTNQP